MVCRREQPNTNVERYTDITDVSVGGVERQADLPPPPEANVSAPVKAMDQGHPSEKLEFIDIMNGEEVPGSIQSEFDNFFRRKQKLMGSTVSCLVVDGKLVGVAKVINNCLDFIAIAGKWQGHGYGRILFNHVCSNLVQKHDDVIIVNQEQTGLGHILYGGETTRKMFNVSFHFTSNRRGNYILSKKRQQETLPLSYIKTDDIETLYRILFDVLACGDIHELIRMNAYLDQFPEQLKELASTPGLEINTLDTSFVSASHMRYEQASCFKETSIKTEFDKLVVVLNKAKPQAT